MYNNLQLQKELIAKYLTYHEEYYNAIVLLWEQGVQIICYADYYVRKKVVYVLRRSKTVGDDMWQA